MTLMLAEQLISAAKHESTSRLFDRLQQGVDEATQPWRFGLCRVYAEYDIDRNLYSYRVHCPAPDGDVWEFYFREADIPANEDQLVDELIFEFTTSFRSWRRDAEPNIILGEN